MIFRGIFKIVRKIIYPCYVGGFTIRSLNMACEKTSIVQYVVVRGDLTRSLEWPAGAVIAQACHAATAVIHLHYNDEDTVKYLADLDNMHKIVLETPNEDCLVNLSAILKKDEVKHKMWIEQPENIPTCIALKPYTKSNVQSYFKKLKLYRG